MTDDEITPAQLGVLVGQFKRTKYRSRRTYVAELERWFDSQREADAAVTLWRRQQAGEIRDLRFQVPYRLNIDGVLICTYVADFVYVERRQTSPTTHPDLWYWDEADPVVADAKGFPTPVYRLKRKLMKAIHGIEIQEL